MPEALLPSWAGHLPPLPFPPLLGVAQPPEQKETHWGIPSVARGMRRSEATSSALFSPQSPFPMPPRGRRRGVCLAGFPGPSAPRPGCHPGGA